MPTANSTTCQVCSNQVRYDNPTFPFCRHHQHLKNSESLSQQVAEEDFDQVRDSFYNAGADFPKNSKNSDGFSQTTADINEEIKSLLPDFDSDVCQGVINRYQKESENIDMSDSSIAYENRDRMIESISQELNSRGIRHDVVDCINGTYINDNKLENVENHKVILIEGDDAKSGYGVVIDPATMAPLHGSVKNRSELENQMGSGTTYFADGISIQPLAEFGNYSTVQYDKMLKSDGSEVWNNMSSNDKEIEELREEKKKLSNYVKPAVNYSAEISRRRVREKLAARRKQSQKANNSANDGGLDATSILKTLLGED